MYIQGMAQNVIVVGEDTIKQCEMCNKFYDPQDSNSPDSDYYRACELRVRMAGPFPADLPQHAATHPHVFCSEDCEQEACDEVRLGHIELDRLIAEGDIEDTPRLDIERVPA